MSLKRITVFTSAIFAFAGVVYAQNLTNSGPAAVIADQEQYVSYWTLEPNWHSELQLRNTSPTGDLLVRPSLRATDGSETALPAVLVHPNEVTDVNLHEALMSLSRQPSSLSGSMVLRYKAEDQGFCMRR